MPAKRNGGDPPDLTTAIAKPSAPASTVAATFTVTVIAGPDEGRSIALDGTEAQRALVGTSPTSSLLLTDRTVSRRHVALDVQGDALRVTDLGSTNGTFVNDVRALDALVAGGETLRVGATILRVARTSGAHARALPDDVRFGRVLGGSAAMRKLLPLFERLAATDVPVVIEGETGTGKELLAESIHETSARSSGPFVVFDCTAVAPNLVESALFGHEKGAFTGAHATKRGVFEQANGGTLLIDEIGELDTTLQPKLLRAIERREVQRVGGDKWIKVDARVVAATRRDLDHEVQAKRFRDDLFFRLAVARVELPPLRDREGDVGLLARHFWRHLAPEDAPFPSDFLERLESYAWPGNVRELHNLVARRAALGDLAPDAPLLSAPASSAPATDAIEAVLALDLPLIRARQMVVDELERRYVERVLAKHGGNATRAAAASGIARRYFHMIKSRHAK